MFWLGFLIGVVVGACLGALLIAFLTASAMADHERQEFPHHPDESEVEVET